MPNPDVRLNHLPVFNDHYGRPERWAGLRVDGLVAEPRTFSAADLDALANARLTDDFRCEEGWRVEDQAWEGVSLAELLQVVRPLPTARYAQVSAAGYSVAVSLFAPDASSAEDLTPARALLANRLNGEAQPEAHGEHDSDNARNPTQLSRRHLQQHDLDPRSYRTSTASRSVKRWRPVRQRRGASSWLWPFGPGKRRWPPGKRPSPLRRAAAASRAPKPRKQQSDGANQQARSRSKVDGGLAG
jgi:hypothetical protein